MGIGRHPPEQVIEPEHSERRGSCSQRQGPASSLVISDIGEMERAIGNRANPNSNQYV